MEVNNKIVRDPLEVMQIRSAEWKERWCKSYAGHKEKVQELIASTRKVAIQNRR